MKRIHPLPAFLCLLCTLLAVPSTAWAFNPPTDTAGPLTIRIADPGEIRALDKPIAVPVTLTNAGDSPLAGTVRVWGVDGWRAEGEAARAFSLAPKGSQVMPFNVVPAADSYAALYPVHARAEFGSGPAKTAAHAILILSVAREAVAKAKPSTDAAKPWQAPRRGPLRLDVATRFQTHIAVHDQPPVAQPAGWLGSDAATGCSVGLTEVDRGQRRRAINVHPPYRTGWGDALLDWHIALPPVKPLVLEFATAIRDHDPKREGTSDGVEFRVQVSTGEAWQDVFSRFSAAKQWEPARVDLSAWAGREITLRLVTDPGPKHDTSCDSAFWAAPTIWVGQRPTPEPDAQRAARRESALSGAREASQGRKLDWTWRLESDAGVHGAALVPGPHGLADAWLAFADGRRELVFEGFAIEVDGTPLAADGSGLVCEGLEPQFAEGVGTVLHRLLQGDQTVRAQARVWAEHGALRVAFSMPNATRDLRGEPRFTALAIGPASDRASRVYAGFGNVIENPAKFDLHANGFQLSTRHIGLDFANGVSLLQACDVFPDLLRVDPDARVYALRTHHDATLTLLPSSRGAFAAARAYRPIANFQPAGGVAKIQGKICLDQWGGDYQEAADGIELAARYGLTDAVFVKHVWQRWGYDYRLPDIYPPAGNAEQFQTLVAACRRHGILFSPHDNYIDFYPDAEGYSYDHIIFNADGTPQLAWFNEGRRAQSYRWLPTAFQPWLERNLKLVKTQIAPTSYFVDVFTAMAPVDFFDRAGRFYPKTVCAERWGAAFDRIRTVLGDNAPMISEAGHDALIGHLDAGQADHMGWTPGRWHFAWGLEAGDAERVPWHDMASHGAFVLLAGGLGPRYSGEQHDPALHGYASDDYLSLTVLGGRNPMCDGPFSRRAVMTYWLLHDVCAELARREMLSHEFAGNDIHRQIVQFADGAQVMANRGRNDWQVSGQTLPAYGFVAQAGQATAMITRRDGVIAGYAQHGHTLFADARPPLADQRGVIEPTVVGCEDLGNRKFQLRMRWRVLQPLPQGNVAFLHFVNEKSAEGEGIAFQGGTKYDAKLAAAGIVAGSCTATLPADVKLPATFAVRTGFYHPGSGGARLRLSGSTDGTGRARCGTVTADAKGAITWKPEPPDPELAERQARLNTAGKLVDFGPVATAGVFRLRYAPGTDWELMPLPGSESCQVQLRLDRLGVPAAKVRQVVAQDLAGRTLDPIAPEQDGSLVRWKTDGQAFRYLIRF